MGNSVQEFRTWLESQHIHLGRNTDKRQKFIDEVISRATSLDKTKGVSSSDGRVTYAPGYVGPAKKPVATVMTKEKSMETDADHGQHDEQRMKEHDEQKRISGV